MADIDRYARSTSLDELPYAVVSRVKTSTSVTRPKVGDNSVAKNKAKFTMHEHSISLAVLHSKLLWWFSVYTVS